MAAQSVRIERLLEGHLPDFNNGPCELVQVRRTKRILGPPTRSIADYGAKLPLHFWTGDVWNSSQSWNPIKSIIEPRPADTTLFQLFVSYIQNILKLITVFNVLINSSCSITMLLLRWYIYFQESLPWAVEHLSRLISHSKLRAQTGAERPVGPVPWPSPFGSEAVVSFSFLKVFTGRNVADVTC